VREPELPSIHLAWRAVWIIPLITHRVNHGCGIMREKGLADWSSSHAARPRLTDEPTQPGSPPVVVGRPGYGYWRALDSFMYSVNVKWSMILQRKPGGRNVLPWIIWVWGVMTDGNPNFSATQRLTSFSKQNWWIRWAAYWQCDFPKSYWSDTGVLSKEACHFMYCSGPTACAGCEPRHQKTHPKEVYNKL